MLTTTGLAVRALQLLIAFDARQGRYKDHRDWVRSRKLQSKTGRAWNEVVRAIDIASAFYCKRVLCLQRSVVLCALLREHGFCAEVVIGARPIPFAAHAWVEVEGRVVGDQPEFVMGLLIIDRIQRTIVGAE